jgi:Protein of unknown function (DUF2515)
LGTDSETDAVEQAVKLAKERAAAGANHPVCATGKCPDSGGPDCSALWNRVNAERNAVINSSQDVEVRNRHISAAYASMYQRQPKFQWIGLASIVSKQAGCAMQVADADNHWYKFGVPGVAKEALAETNKVIFATIFPMMRFYELSDLKTLIACSSDPNGKKLVPDNVVKAITKIDKGDAQSVREGSDLIASYEQEDIVQREIYSNKTYRLMFEMNEQMAKSGVGRSLGARPAELPLSSKCNEGKNIPFDGSIANADDRVAYYKKLMDQFTNLDVKDRNAIIEDIKKQGQ